MDSNEVVSNLTVIGIAVTVISFIAYVFSPNPVFIGTFVIGIIMMVVGYTFVIHQNRTTDRELEARMEELDRRGYIMSLDDSYVPYQDEATIEILE